MEDRSYHVYIMTNPGNTVIYTGMTGNLSERIRQHQEKLVPGFTSRYSVTKLVYVENFSSAYEAITREKQIKAGSRRKKIELIEKDNPRWEDITYLMT